MAYIPQIWLPRLGTGLNKFTDQHGNVYILTPTPDEITQEGTPFSADRMNHIEEGVLAASQLSGAYYGASSTPAATAAKTATVDGFEAEHLKAGTIVSILFTSGNTTASPTLNINGLGAKQIDVSNNLPLSSLIGNTQPAMFQYDGTKWWLINPRDDYVPLVGGTMTGALTLNGDPTAAMHAATKQYTDNFALRELVRFTVSGTFDPASYPSKNNLYLIVAVGGGGGGGGSKSSDYRNGLRGYVTSAFAVITASQTVTIGAGGIGTNYPTLQGNNGGQSSLGSVAASGGFGGWVTITPFFGTGNTHAYGNYGTAGTASTFEDATDGTSGIVVVYGFPV